ncbi:MAG TPA: ATP-binding protein, partial [Labilithrix sp.]|nr:ATP-binding protein [Labilithrix sp.]
FPMLPLTQTFSSEHRLRVRGSIPPPYAPCVAFFHLFEGCLVELPSVLGLPNARIVRSEVTARSIDAEIELPVSRSLFARARRVASAALHARELLDLLEQQREAMADELEAVRRSTGEVHALFDRIPDLVIIHRGGRILWKNRAVVKALGHEQHDDLIGKPLLEIVAPASRDLVRERMTGGADGDAPDLVEAWLLARDGSSILVEVSPSQVVSFDGQPARLVVGRDVTERIRLQQQLLTADRMASIGMLAAGVAHEVNNPLAYVLNNVEIAMKALAPLGESTQQSRDALAVALEGVDRIRTIVRELLVLSRVDDRAVGPVDVRAVVESTLALAANKIAERARLTCELHPVPLARGTAARLGQVLLNLVANAVEAMPESTRATNELRVRVLEQGGRVVVEVSDDGVGILPEHAGRVFDPFFTTKPFGAGTGLGLAISQRLVTEIGGELTFESTPQRGSTFRVALPASD